MGRKLTTWLVLRGPTNLLLGAAPPPQERDEDMTWKLTYTGPAIQQRSNQVAEKLRQQTQPYMQAIPEDAPPLDFPEGVPDDLKWWDNVPLVVPRIFHEQVIRLALGSIHRLVSIDRENVNPREMMHLKLVLSSAIEMGGMILGGIQTEYETDDYSALRSMMEAAQVHYDSLGKWEEQLSDKVTNSKCVEFK